MRWTLGEVGVDVRFWGVRGSIPVSGAEYAAGGNTPCVEISHAGHRLILDGGSGLRQLGAAQRGAPIDATLLFSHVHWDHIQGVPFFGPAFHPGSSIQIIGAARESGSVRDALARQMNPPTFPITLDALRARISWRDVIPGQSFEDGPFRITAIDMPHPDGVFGWRVEAAGKSVVFATDVEHGGEIWKALVDAAQACDLLIHDAQYTRDEYEGRGGPPRRGWGHSTIEEATEVARRAEARQLVLFHHDPSRTDAQLLDLEMATRQVRPGTIVAREGAEHVLHLDGVG